jgi:hypothetical protein
MDTEGIVEAIDAEIKRLQGAKALLDGTRPGNRKRTMSAAGRARIAAAQNLRWAKAKKAVK